MKMKFETEVKLIEPNAKPKPAFKVVSAADVMDEWMKRQQRWLNEKRFGSVSFDEQCGAIVFHFDERTDNYRYWMPFDEVRTAEGQIWWLNHLRTKKGWFTITVMNDLMDCLAAAGVLQKRKAKPSGEVLNGQ